MLKERGGAGGGGGLTTGLNFLFASRWTYIRGAYKRQLTVFISVK